jgi:hypothetical protein
LLHDIGKPKAQQMDKSGVWTFYRHEEISSEMCRKMLRRLRYSNTVIENVCHLIKEHMFHYTDDWGDSAVRRFIARVGEENIQDLYRLRRADSFAQAGKEPDPRSLLSFRYRVEKALGESRAFTVKDLAVSGNDLMAIGIQPGKSMGIILNELLETVLDDPLQNTREKLLEIAGKFFTEKFPG